MIPIIGHAFLVKRKKFGKLLGFEKPQEVGLLAVSPDAFGTVHPIPSNHAHPICLMNPVQYNNMTCDNTIKFGGGGGFGRGNQR